MTQPRVALVGAGRWGPNLLRNLHRSANATVTWVVDKDTQRTAALLRDYEGIRASSQPSEAIHAADVDAVVVATPTVTHYELVREALDAGKHVFVEKPITNTATRGQELTRIAEVKNRVLMVGHVFLYNPAVQAAKALLANETLGSIQYLTMRRTNLGPVRMDVNASWDLASHDVSIANWWLGERPVSAAATGHAWINPPLHDAVFATLRYPGDVLCHIEASWLHPQKERRIAVVGSEKMLTLDDLDRERPVRVYDKRVTDEETSPTFLEGKFRIHLHEGPDTTPPIAEIEPLGTECEEFLRCIREGVQPASNGTFASEIVAALEAIDASLGSGGAETEIRYPDLA